MLRRPHELQRRCAQRLDGLQLAATPDVSTFCRELADRRGRRLHLMALPSQPGAVLLCGAWIPLAGEDFIFVEQTLSPWYQDFTVLHECAHMLSDHTPSARAAVPWMQRVFPDLDERLIRGALFRHEYARPEEREADMTAALIAAGLNRPGRRVVASPPAAGDSALDSLARALGASGR